MGVWISRFEKQVFVDQKPSTLELFFHECFKRKETRLHTPSSNEPDKTHEKKASRVSELDLISKIDEVWKENRDHINEEKKVENNWLPIIEGIYGESIPNKHKVAYLY